MDSQLSQDPLDRLDAYPEISQPTTPELSHALIPEATATAVNKPQSYRRDSSPSNMTSSLRNMTPPPSTQMPSSIRAKTRTPTPPISHISTPPPTVELPSESQRNRLGGGFAGSMTVAKLEAASPEELRQKVSELQAALQEAKMSAAHHKLQYQMLSQESAAALERMQVEARMAHMEDEVIYTAEHARSAATPTHISSAQEGIIPVQKDLYQRMCREIQVLGEANHALERECLERERMSDRQDIEIASLTDKVTLMRERIRENREQMQKHRRTTAQQFDATSRSVYSTPQRPHVSSQPQPFAALLQASEMASQESARSAGRGMPIKKGHSRGTHSMSSLPSTPQRVQKLQQPTFHTPSGRQPHIKVPSTAPMPRTSALRTPDVYSQLSLPISQPEGPQSDGTVSASENDDDSEAETDIIEQDNEIHESQASRAASEMLRSSQEQQAKRDSFQGSGMLETSRERMRQTKLFGAVRKANVDRGDEPPTKRARTGEREREPAVGLGIAGVRG